MNSNIFSKCPQLFFQGLVLVLTAGNPLCGEPSVSSREVSIGVEGAVLAGTLSIPDGKLPHPAILLLCGSGEQDRDWDIDRDGRFRMGVMLADALGESGIAVLRLDDRGTGKSTGQRESLTGFETLKEDALAALAFLRDQPGLGPVGIGGLSSGSEIALMAAAGSTEIDFLLLLSGPFVPGSEILMAQARAFPEVFVPNQPDSREELVKKALEFQSLCIAAARGQETEDLLRVLRENTRFILGRLPAEELAGIEDLDTEIEKQSREILSGFQSEWFRSFVNYNPARDLPRISCPILALYGASDNRVIADNGWKALLAALLERNEVQEMDVSIRVLPGTNHFLTSRDYALKGMMNPGITDILAGWILEKAGAGCLNGDRGNL